MYITIVGDWSVETTHDIDPESSDYEAACANAVQPTIDLADAWESWNHSHQFTDENGTQHEIVVRKIDA